jgi:hypothetical protein
MASWPIELGDVRLGSFRQSIGQAIPSVSEKRVDSDLVELCSEACDGIPPTGGRTEPPVLILATKTVKTGGSQARIFLSITCAAAAAPPLRLVDNR